MAVTNLDGLRDAMLKPAFRPEGDKPVAAMSDPIADTPMMLTLDDVLAYDSNPRTTRNPKYVEIKESIRHRGLDTPPPVTKRPGEDKYRIRNGGNTRLAILKELYQETGDERFFRINCLFRPWDQARGEIIALTGHLAENDLQGQLLFIERALGIDKARELYEQEAGAAISQRELSRRLAADGYPISQSHISKMQDCVRYLLPAIPGVLYSGMGVDRISRLLSLRKSAQNTWSSWTEDGAAVEFETLFVDVLSMHDSDAEDFAYDAFIDALIGQMKPYVQRDYESILLDITQQQDRLRRSTPVVEVPVTTVPVERRAAELTPPEPVQTPGQLAQPSNGVGSPQTERLEHSTASGTSSEPGRPGPQSALSDPTPAPAASQIGVDTPPDPETLSEEERQERLDGHVVSPSNLSEKALETKRRIAAMDGEELPDFNADALRAIPVQAGSFYPIMDIWYIERAIETPHLLRQRIAALAREIARSVGATGSVQETSAGVGYVYHPGPAEPHVEESPLTQHTITMLQSLSATMMLVLPQVEAMEDPLEVLGEFRFAAGLGQLLMGIPTTESRDASDEGRLSDGALVKLFRLIRLARRLIDLESTPAEPMTDD